MKFNIKILILFFALFWSVSCGDEADSENTEPEIEEVNDLEEDDSTQDDTQLELGDAISSELALQSIIIVSAIVILFGAGSVAFFIYFVPIKLWYEAYLSGVKVSWLALIKMRWQGVPQALVLRTVIKAQNAGYVIKSSELADHYLAQVNI